MSVTIIIIGITILVSVLAESNTDLKRKLLFNAYLVKQHKEYYRILSHGFIHGGYGHLAINMWVLYLFGRLVEAKFTAAYAFSGNLYFVLMYLGGMGVATLTSLKKHGDDPSYNALGASGAVSSVLFASIIFFPLEGIGLIFIPGIFIPAFIFGALYLWYESYMDKRGGDGVAHDAHFMGAIFGVAFVVLIDFQNALLFFNQVQSYISQFL